MPASPPDWRASCIASTLIHLSRNCKKPDREAALGIAHLGWIDQRSLVRPRQAELLEMGEKDMTEWLDAWQAGKLAGNREDEPC